MRRIYANTTLFAASSRAAQLRMGEFNAQVFANTAWAFAKLGQSDGVPWFQAMQRRSMIKFARRASRQRGLSSCCLT